MPVCSKSNLRSKDVEANLACGAYALLRMVLTSAILTKQCLQPPPSCPLYSLQPVFIVSAQSA
eukprot:354346-Chlamydomonas_euryale.AAC.15